MLFVSKKFPSDSDLMEGLQQGFAQKRKAETLLFEKYYNFIKEGVRKHRLTEDEAASAYSDAIMGVINNVASGKFEGRSELKTFIYQIFSNKCVDQIRKNTTNKAAVHDAFFIDDDFQLADESKNIVQKMMLEAEITALYRKLALIGEKCKQMILLWGEAFTDEEIAKELQYNSAAVAKTSRLRCLEKLREI